MNMAEAVIIARVRQLHSGPRTERHGSGCVQCGLVWPCPTRRACDGHEIPGMVTVARADVRRIVEVAATYLDMCEPPPVDDLVALERLQRALGDGEAVPDGR